MLLMLCAGPAAPADALPPVRIGMIEGMSGQFANAGEAVQRNLQWSIERVNARGGVKLLGGARRLELVAYDSKGNTDEALMMLRSLTDDGVPFVAQGNSSAVAGALVAAIEKHNARMPQRRVLYLNYSAVDPVLTNERCSFWHFRFDAHAGMRMSALTDAMKADRQIRRVYIIGQDYSFGREVSRLGRQQLAVKRPDIEIVGDELHPIGRVKDFAPYISKIIASSADAVLTGNWGNDLTLLVKSARDAGMAARFYTFYGNGLGAPAAMGLAGVDRVLAVAEWHPNVGGAESDAFVEAFRRRYPEPRYDYQHLRMNVMVEMLVAAIEKAGTTEAAAVAKALEGMRFNNGFHEATMRAEDHQLIQPLYVSVMEKAGDVGVRFDNEGSGYGFRTMLRLKPEETALPSSCRMNRSLAEAPR
ncbi:MAG: branched-chain amino acid ABC transporter substrate-binding protein [Burkholderiales bacterium]|nr:branched-chain amino acid ABC transporter substrate-binding protein [Burkholderiales bacterium]